MTSTAPFVRNFHHVFQPVIDLRDDKIFGFEVLLRSSDGRKPEHIFAAAKLENTLYELDTQSIFHACKTGLKVFGHVNLMINVYPSTMVHPDFLPFLKEMRELLGFTPSNLIFEINESEKKEDVNTLFSVICELKRDGYLIALDDIGKGDATLHSMIEYEPDIAKFDKYFVKDLATSSKKRRYLKKIMEVFGEDMHFVLEGLETKEQVQITKSLDIPLAQGFYLGKPQPSAFYEKEA